MRPNPSPTHPLLRSSHDPYHISFHPLHLRVILVVMLAMLFKLIMLFAFEAMFEPVLVFMAMFVAMFVVVVVIVILVQFGGNEATEVAVRHAQTARNARIHIQRVVRRRVPLSLVLPTPTPEETERHALGPFVDRHCTPSSAFPPALAVGVPSSGPSTAEPSPPSHRLIPAPPTSLHRPRRLRRAKARAQSSSGE